MSEQIPTELTGQHVRAFTIVDEKVIGLAVYDAVTGESPFLRVSFTEENARRIISSLVLLYKELFNESPLGHGRSKARKKSISPPV